MSLNSEFSYKEMTIRIAILMCDYNAHCLIHNEKYKSRNTTTVYCCCCRFLRLIINLIYFYFYLPFFIANLLTLGFGMILAWASPMLPLLMSDKTPLPSGPITSDDSANSGALFCGGASVCTILFGFLADRYGRKIGGYISVALLLIAWIITILATSVWHILLARLIAGFFSGGVWFVIPLFVTEITDHKIRGSLGAYLPIMSCTGIMLGYGLGGFLDYYTFAYLSMIVPIIFIILFYRLPETPPYLLSKNKLEEARISAEFYFGEVIDEKIPLAEYLGVENRDEEEKGFNFSALCTRPAMKGTVIYFILVMMTQLSGNFLINNYMKTIFTEAGISIDTDIASIFVAVLQTFGCILSSILVDRAGRRILLILSSLLTGLCQITLSLYLFFKFNGYYFEFLNWIPVAAIGGAVFCVAWGITPITFILGNEILSQNVRGFAAALGLTSAWFTGLLLLKYFYVLLDVLQLQGSMLLFGCLCLCETVFALIFIPETKGKSIDEIIKML